MDKWKTSARLVIGMTEEKTEVDFDVVSENWTRYKLSDGTILRVKVILPKIYMRSMSDIGFPNFEGGGSNLLSAIVPAELKGASSQEKLTPEDIKAGEELGFSRLLEETWQEYKILGQPWIVMIRPVVVKVIRTKKYNEFGEPVYWASIQHILNVKKA